MGACVVCFLEFCSSTLHSGNHTCTQQTKDSSLMSHLYGHDSQQFSGHICSNLLLFSSLISSKSGNSEQVKEIEDHFTHDVAACLNWPVYVCQHYHWYITADYMKSIKTAMNATTAKSCVWKDLKSITGCFQHSEFSSYQIRFDLSWVISSVLWDMIEVSKTTMCIDLLDNYIVKIFRRKDLISHGCFFGLTRTSSFKWASIIYRSIWYTVDAKKRETFGDKLEKENKLCYANNIWIFSCQ